MTPGEIRIGGQALTVLRRVLLTPAPEEGCALLLGHTDAAAWRLQSIWPCLNVWQPALERTHRFAIDPREQLQAQKWARRRGLAVLGSAHSHPAAPPLPSATDRALGFGPTLMLILGCAAADEPDLQCWWLPDPVAGEQAPPKPADVENGRLKRLWHRRPRAPIPCHASSRHQRRAALPR